MKSNIENRRSGNEFGTVIWQLGEIWPTGGWGSLEYGTFTLSIFVFNSILLFTFYYSSNIVQKASPEKGQVLGGRWKPLHYFLHNALFRDVIATCGTDARCYIKNDGVQPFYGEIQVTAIDLASGKTSTVLNEAGSLGPGAGAMSWFCLEYL